MANAVYEVKNKGHFGLAAPAYVHFTSPIRRYADLFNHRNLKRFLTGQKPASPNAQDAKHISGCEKNASAAESRVSKFYRFLYAERLIGQTFNGKISAVTRKGVFVDTEEKGIEGLIPEGGESRAASVRNGMKYLDRQGMPDFVYVHDAVRPFITLKLIQELLLTAQKSGAAAPAVNPVETVRLSDADGHYALLNRDNLKLMQTPQVICADYVRRFFLPELASQVQFTDEISVVENLAEVLS
ncbi:hypothetical protein CHS0354_001953 [Potamilus streckersoni]|uniref:S1 motif domain-containing protein n=1 Tax=Potamilus streckersoni TaxID=2493646 RepID=A0AAE0T5J1_9BIVA|nr:hypothetical protein CHS0354_001953 [Potamilus streckersoni]